MWIWIRDLVNPGQGSRIKKSDRGSGVIIPDPRHCCQLTVAMLYPKGLRYFAAFDYG
jgi:hypothetical protein